MNFNDYPINDIVGLASVAQKAERWTDMRQIVHHMVMRKMAHKVQLNIKERMLLTSAYKNPTSLRRKSLRKINEGTNSKLSAECIKKYKGMIVAELEEICEEQIQLLYMMKGYEEKENKHDDEMMVFLLKTLADYHRYLAEFKKDHIFVENADKFYEEAFDLARRKLPAAHPSRLEVALNYSVYCQELAKKEDEACSITKNAIKYATAELDPRTDYYMDSLCILQLLRDNLTHWTTKDEDELLPLP